MKTFRRTLVLLYLTTLFTGTQAYSQSVDNRPQLSAMIPVSDYLGSLPDTVSEHYRSFRGLVLEEVYGTELYPLLTYVFFDEGSAEIPKRYKLFSDPAETLAFSDTTTSGGSLQQYYHILNIIGYRMRKHPNSIISLSGFNSTGPSAPANQIDETPETSKKRRDVVFNYLTNIWQIDPSRIKLVRPSSNAKNGLPKERSSVRDPLGMVEKRRAEIRSDDWEIMKPIVVKETRRFHSPNNVTFHMTNGIPDSLVERREIWIYREGKEWHRMTDLGMTVSQSSPYNWCREGNIDSAIPKDGTPYVAQLVVYSKGGNVYRSNEIEIPVMIVSQNKKRLEGLPDKTIDRYSLVLFKFDSDGEGPLNSRILKTHVYPNVRPGAEINITGYTDVVGLEDRNLKLSIDRAETVHKSIKQHVPSNNIASLVTKGVGETEPLYANNLPEGRFYNRTVQIIVETPVGDN